MAKASAPAARRYLHIGTITGPHGIRGEVKVQLMTDYPERFKPGADLYLGTDADARPVKIASVRPHKTILLVGLASVHDRNAAELMRGMSFLIPEDEAMPLAENENYAHDLVGMSVETSDGESLGVLTEILFTGANDVYVVSGPTGEILLPALKDVVLSVDVPSRKMVVVLPDGLRD
jgi:16S rRNA processing protein RimM